jgi:hypothetical protein
MCTPFAFLATVAQPNIERSIPQLLGGPLEHARLSSTAIG